MSNILNLETSILYNSIKIKTPEEEEEIIKQGLKKMTYDMFMVKITQARSDAIRQYTRLTNHQTNTTLYKTTIPLLT